EETRFAVRRQTVRRRKRRSGLLLIKSRVMKESPNPKIIVRGVSMDYPDHQRAKASSGGKKNGFVPVLENIDLEVEDGEFVCIVGPSGCGKSTLLNIIGGFLKATRGEVLIDGVAVAAPDPRRIFIFQENGIFPWLTVEDNIGFGLLNKTPEDRH